MTTTFKQARTAAGLSVKQAADLLCVDPVTVRRFEMATDKKTARPAPPLLIRVLHWYAAQTPPALD